MKKTFLIGSAAVLILCLAAGGIFLARGKTASVTEPVYLALGDSISAGTALGDGEDSFPELLKRELAFGTLWNDSRDGLTSERIYQSLLSGKYDCRIEKAELITITAGGNDLLETLYGAVAEQYNETSEGEPMDHKAVRDAFKEGDYSLLLSAVNVLKTLHQTDAIPRAVERYAANMEGILQYIRAHNQEAKVVVITQYNPYSRFSGVFSVLNTGVESGVTALNEALFSLEKKYDFALADVYALFGGAAENYCNASMMPIQLDVHPNAAGHRAIASAIKSLLAEE